MFRISSLGTNKDQLLHRIQSVKKFTIVFDLNDCNDANRNSIAFLNIIKKEKLLHGIPSKFTSIIYNNNTIR
jgi:hypothetical protein